MSILVKTAKIQKYALYIYMRLGHCIEDFLLGLGHYGIYSFLISDYFHLLILYPVDSVLIGRFWMISMKILLGKFYDLKAW